MRHVFYVSIIVENGVKFLDQLFIFIPIRFLGWLHTIRSLTARQKILIKFDSEN